ncbi:MAG: hypothetical protein ACYC75_00755 [Minisyncoccota bacterium]
MRRIFTISFITLSLVIGAAGAAPAAHAATSCKGGSGAQGTCAATCGGNLTADNGLTNSCGTGNQCCVDTTQYCMDASASNYGKAGTCAIAGSAPSISPPPVNSGAPAQGSDNTAATNGFGTVMTWIMSLFAWLVGVAALTLDYAVYYTVITMGDYVHNLTAVGVAWRILRDVANIMLIFGFLAAGIATILNVEFYGWSSKMLPKLLMVAVLLNFSLFISEVVIDAGNLVATQFYTQINGGNMPTSKTLSDITVGIPGGGANMLGNEGISNAIMAQLGLQTIYNADRTNTAIFQAGNTWVIGFMSIILFMITAFVLFMLAFVLITRFVYLILLIILSPVGLVGYAVPALADRSAKWRHEILHQTFIAPALLLLLYVALTIITDAHFLTGFCIPGATATFGGPNTNTTCTSNVIGWVSGNFQGFASFILSFLVAMVLLLYIAMKAKEWGAVGADWATRTAGKITFGATAWGMNRTVGRGAYFLGRGLRHNETFNKVNAMTGRVMSRTLDRTATGSFDMRGIKTGGGLKTFGDVGTPAKDGFVGARTRNIKDHEEEVKRIETAYKDAHKESPEELAAAEAHEKAEEAKAKAQEEYNAAERIQKRHGATLKALEVEKMKDGNGGRFWENNPTNVKRVNDAKAAFETATDNLNKASVNFKAATTAESEARKEKKNVDSAAKKEFGDAIKASKIAYAKGIDHPLNPITFVAYGPDTGGAARKIIKDATKTVSDKDKAYAAMKKVLDDEEVEKKNSGGENTGEKKEEPQAPSSPGAAKP